MCQRWDVMGWLYIGFTEVTDQMDTLLYMKETIKYIVCSQEKKSWKISKNSAVILNRRPLVFLFGFCCFGFFFTIAWLICHLNSDGNILYYYVIFWLFSSLPTVSFQTFFLISTNSIIQIFLGHFIRTVTQGNAPPSLEHWSVTCF